MKNITKYIILSFVLFVCDFSIAIADEEEHTIISSFKTQYGDYGRYRGRAHNIRLASAELSPIVLNSREVFSFNEILGQRTREAGYKTAPIISGGRMTTGYGGGICQVASTLHAAVLNAGLNVIEAHSHSRISSYINPGLDVAVDYETKDFVFVNSFSFPIKIIINTSQIMNNTAGEIEVLILGKEKPFQVNLKVVKRIRKEPEIKYILNQELQPGQQRIVQPGTPEMYIRTIREIIPYSSTIAANNAEIIDERVYRMSERIILKGPE